MDLERKINGSEKENSSFFELTEYALQNGARTLERIGREIFLSERKERTSPLQDSLLDIYYQIYFWFVTSHLSKTPETSFRSKSTKEFAKNLNEYVLSGLKNKIYCPESQIIRYEYSLASLLREINVFLNEWQKNVETGKNTTEEEIQKELSLLSSALQTILDINRKTLELLEN